MKKLILTLVIAVMSIFIVGFSVNAFFYDSELVNVWNRRPDLQRAFPDEPSTNSKLLEWAKKYGWKEDETLFKYSPSYSVISKVVDEKTNSLQRRIVELETRLALLENGNNVTQTASTDTLKCYVKETSKGGELVCETNRLKLPKITNGDINNTLFTGCGSQQCVDNFYADIEFIVELPILSSSW